MGYSGGTSENPTYYILDSHSETVQIDYDPSRISYAELLDVFWQSHRPETTAISCQYKSIILYHNEEQKKLAMGSRERAEAGIGLVETEIRPFERFWIAEDYHQKWELQQENLLKIEFHEIYPDPEDFVNSTAAARVNGYAGGYGSLEQLYRELDSLGLSPEAQELLIEKVSIYERQRESRLI